MEGSPKSTESRIVNLGCGRKKLDHALNVDLTSTTNPDLVHDLNIRPWPLPDDHATEVFMTDVLEHLNDIVAVMEEIHRVCSPGATVRITVPHFSCANAFTDPTHRHYFGWFSMDYFTGEHEHAYYTEKRFRMGKRVLIFRPTLVNKAIGRIANSYPEYYESRWTWIFPAWFLYFELTVLKGR